MPERMDQPREPRLFMTPERSWVVGEPGRVMASWTYACDGTGGWGCPPSAITVLDVGCQGCEILEDPRGISGPGRVQFTAAAMTDEAITITAMLRFDPTGDVAQVSNTTVGDHEIGVEGRCRLIDSATLAQRNLEHTVPGELFRSCESGRLATDTVVVFPAMRTFHGDTRLPICVTSTLCGGFDGELLRPPSALTISPAPTGWGSSDEIAPNEFAILPAMPSGGTVELTAQLSPAGTATASVEIPAAP